MSYNLPVDRNPLAAIDIGTNTFRLLIAEVHHDPRKDSFSLREIHSERIITRLGEGIHDKGLLSEDAVSRSLSVLKGFSDTISRLNVYRTSAVATSALREAANSAEFIKKARRVTGLDIKIISGEEEARITASGMLIDMPVPASALLTDIGGGSTELIFARNGRPLSVCSLNLGVVYLAGRYMKEDPPAGRDLTLMEGEISRRVRRAVEHFAGLCGPETVFIGTAGTITTLSAVTQSLVTFEHDRIHNSRLRLDQVKDIYSAISVMPARERAGYIGLEPARLDIIVPGALILLRLMEAFGFSEITVSNYGLREGILVDLYNRL
ncbi:MAG: Ppx/GppA family phosphatase [Deferribacteres bacterium]|nr:Ppx/GppA family phosphatase [Deferribacteres bacterium]